MRKKALNMSRRYGFMHKTGYMKIAIGILVLGMAFSTVTIAPPPPVTVYGYIHDSNGDPVPAGVHVTVYDIDTGEYYNTTIYDAIGRYQSDFGAYDGEVVNVNVSYSDEEGSNQTIIDTSAMIQWCNVTLQAVNQSPVFSGEIPSNGSTVPISTSSLDVTIEDPEGDTFDWNIETSPNVGSSSGTGESNGTKSCSISGLDYSTTYTWWVNATDAGSGEWTREMYTFTTESAPNNPPNKPANPSPADGDTDVSINPTLIVEVSDPDGNMMDVTFYDASNGLIGTDTGVANDSDASVPWSGLDYDTTYEWYAVANDSELENTSNTWSFTTRGVPPLTAYADGPYSGYVNKSISLHGLAYGGIPPYLYEWDLDNDGEYDDSTEQNPTYTWSTAGTKTVGLKVTDSDTPANTDTDTTTVEVSSAAPTPVPVLTSIGIMVLAGLLSIFAIVAIKKKRNKI